MFFLDLALCCRSTCQFRWNSEKSNHMLSATSNIELEFLTKFLNMSQFQNSNIDWFCCLRGCHYKLSSSRRFYFKILKWKSSEWPLLMKKNLNDWKREFFNSQVRWSSNFRNLEKQSVVKYIISQWFYTKTFLVTMNIQLPLSSAVFHFDIVFRRFWFLNLDPKKLTIRVAIHVVQPGTAGRMMVWYIVLRNAW